MKRIVLKCLIGLICFWGLGAMGLVVAQQFRLDISSYPDSAKVLLNGEEVAKTPEYFYSSRRKAIGGTVEIVKPGYKTEKVVIPVDLNDWHFNWVGFLTPQYTFKLDSASSVITFEKLLVDIPNGKIIGKASAYYGISTDIHWDRGASPEEMRFVNYAYDVLGTAGFNVPIVASTGLFEQYGAEQKEGQYVIGGDLKAIWINYYNQNRFSSALPHYYTVTSKIEWQVFDMVSQKVVLSGITDGNYGVHQAFRPYSELVLDACKLSLQEFLMDGKLAKLANESRGEIQDAIRR